MKNKIQKPVYPPRTIADLKFDWRITRKAHDNLFIAQDKILEKIHIFPDF